MDMDRTGYLVAEIHVEHKEGSFHIFSKEIPGFHLCAWKLEGLDEDISSAIEFFFKSTKNLDVRVEKAASPLALMKKAPIKKNHDVARYVMTPAFAVA